jgi:hypothetical protein
LLLACRCATINVMRGVALAVGLSVIGCGGAGSPGPSGTDSGSPPADAAADADGGAGDLADADPFQCSTVAPLLLSNPTVTSGTVAAGQTVTLQITLTDTDPSGYVSYPGAVLTSTTPGVTFRASDSGPPGAYIDGTASKPITFYVMLDASIPAGTELELSARAYGWGHPAPDCNGFVLSFSLMTTA